MSWFLKTKVVNSSDLPTANTLLSLSYAKAHAAGLIIRLTPAMFRAIEILLMAAATAKGDSPDGYSLLMMMRMWFFG